MAFSNRQSGVAPWIQTGEVEFALTRIRLGAVALPIGTLLKLVDC